MSLIRLNKSIQKILITALIAPALAVLPLHGQTIPSEADGSDELATEAESRVDTAEEAVSEESSARGDAAESTETTTATETTEDTTDTETTSTETTDSTTTDAQGGALYNDGKMNYATSRTRFELSSTDQLSTLDFIEYKIDDSSFQAYTSPFSIETEGQHRIIYRGVDKVGNREPESVFVVIIDNTPPDVHVNSPAKLLEKDGRYYAPDDAAFQIRATDRYSGVRTVEYSINGEDYQEYTEPIKLTEAGEHNIKYRAIDNLGNSTDDANNMMGDDSTTSTVQTIAYRVYTDDNAPRVAIRPSRRLINVNNQTYALRETVFHIDAADDESGVDKVLVKIDGEAEFKPYVGPINFSVEGNHIIEAKAVDFVGNESEVQKLEMIVDDNPPETTIRPVTE